MPPFFYETFLTGHCVAMARFPHEPIDFVTNCILCCRVRKLWKTGYMESPHSRTAQKTRSLNRVIDQKWKLHLEKKLWIPWLEIELKEYPWQKTTMYFWIFFWNVWKRNGTTCSHQTYMHFQDVSEDWHDVVFTK